ncbi:MAG: Zn-dependent hydrolase [Actinomycetota bacterium]
MTIETDLPRVDGARLWSRLMDMAEIGATDRGGSNRQALSDDDAAGRALFESWAQAAGCTIELDEVGNLFARRAGRDDSLAPVMVGSHLDTQPTGGRFDGVYGVLAGLEVVERLNDFGRTTARPIEIVVWTNEEGSRFPMSMMGSAVWAGKTDLGDVRALTDIDGISVGSELDRLGWAGSRPAARSDYRAAFELHIEQGPLLEADDLPIGVVTGVQGLRWFTIELMGSPAHAGPTPMEVRRDPARAVADIISAVYAAVAEAGEWARGTFAQFSSTPVSPNTVPELVRFSLDLRHPDGDVLDGLEQQMRAIVASAAARHRISAVVEKQNDSPPVAFAPDCVESVADAAEALGLPARRMVSGAGHDACYVAGHCPTAMIFVPCEDGLSHNEAENIEAAQAEAGADVLLNAVLRFADEP